MAGVKYLRPEFQGTDIGALFEIEKGRRFLDRSRPTKRRPNICDSFFEKIRFLRGELPVQKGRRPQMFVPDPRNTGSNLGRGSEIRFHIHGTVKRILGEKSPETVDAPGFHQTHLYRFAFMVDLKRFELSTPTMRM